MTTHISDRNEGVSRAVIYPQHPTIIGHYLAERDDDAADLLARVPENKPGDALIELPYLGSMSELYSAGRSRAVSWEVSLRKRQKRARH